jgi:hypothetical protein
MVGLEKCDAVELINEIKLRAPNSHKKNDNCEAMGKICTYNATVVGLLMSLERWHSASEYVKDTLRAVERELGDGHEEAEFWRETMAMVERRSIEVKQEEGSGGGVQWCGAWRPPWW